MFGLVSCYYHVRLRTCRQVEGVVQHGQRPGLFRAVKQVKVTVHSTQVSKAQMINDAKVGSYVVFVQIFIEIYVNLSKTPCT